MSTHESLGDTPEVTLRVCKVRAEEMSSKLISFVTLAEGLDLIANTIQQLIIIHNSSFWALNPLFWSLLVVHAHGIQACV